MQGLIGSKCAAQAHSMFVCQGSYINTQKAGSDNRSRKDVIQISPQVSVCAPDKQQASRTSFICMISQS